MSGRHGVALGINPRNEPLAGAANTTNRVESSPSRSRHSSAECLEHLAVHGIMEMGTVEGDAHRIAVLFHKELLVHVQAILYTRAGARA